MTHYQDLTPYEYWTSVWPPDPPEQADRWLNIGWLAKGHAYVTGTSSKEFIAALTELAANPARLTRGVYHCDFCEERSPIKVITPSERIAWLGNGEIAVPARDEKVFLAPTLIVHYIEKHRYRPPPEFIDAVMGDLPRLKHV